MKSSIYLLALWLLAAPAVLRADDLPVVFARSGRNVTIPVGGSDGKAVALWTLGQRWGEPTAVHNGMVDLVAPGVRAPLVFRLMPTDGSKVGLAELVVFPNQPVPWDKDTQLLAFGVPNWFDTWSEAVGLPVQKLKDVKTLAAGNWRMLEKPAILILGPEAAGHGSQLACKLASEHKISVLVLETDWFSRNRTLIREAAVLPKQMQGTLAALQTQEWPLPPVFGQRAVCVLNRQTWIAGPEHPLVEEIRGPQPAAAALRIVFSYLPWPEQLGHTEAADQLLLRLLAEVAKGAKGRPPLDGRWVLLCPAATEIKAAERPVLAAAMKSAESDAVGRAEPQKVRACVLDLRGKASPAVDFLEDAVAVKAIEAQIGPRAPLLILGDSQMLDAWKWLRLDRPRRQSMQPGIVWLPDNSLPPSIDSQLRLMQLFTEWNIRLDDISQE
jgi:hypothetical protein